MARWPKILLLAGFAVYVLAGEINPRVLSFLSGADLLFHEAGHALLAFFPDPVPILGGTLMQIFIPAGIAAGFVEQGNYFSSSVMLVWLAENLIGVSVYIADAREMAMPYVGGETHDWNYLLTKWNLLAYDDFLAGCVRALSVLVVLMALIYGIRAVLCEGQAHKRKGSTNG